MTTLLRVDTSIRTEGSVSRGLADLAQEAWESEHPDTTVIHRDLGLEPLPADAWSAAVAGTMFKAPDALPTPQQRAATTLATSLADELIEADAVIVATPLYNYGVPQHLKAWIDLLIIDDRLKQNRVGEFLAGKPLVLAVARGGGYGPGTPRDGWDHATPYLRRIFGDVFGMDVHEAAAELTLAPVVPEMASLVDLAKASHETARAAVVEHGRTAASRVRTAA